MDFNLPSPDRLTDFTICSGHLLPPLPLHC